MLSCEPISLVWIRSTRRRADDVSGNVRVQLYPRERAGSSSNLSIGWVRVTILCYGYGSGSKMLYPQSSIRRSDRCVANAGNSISPATAKPVAKDRGSSDMLAILWPNWNASATSLRSTNRDRQRHRRTDEQTDSINKDMQIVVHTGRRTDYNTARGGNRQSSFTFR